MKQLKNGSMTIQRVVLLDGLVALYISHYKVDCLLKEGDYANGYRQGYEDALLSMSHMIGVSEEIEIIKSGLLTNKI